MGQLHGFITHADNQEVVILPQQAAQRTLVVEQKQAPGNHQQGVNGAEHPDQPAAYIGAEQIQAGMNQDDAGENQLYFIEDDLCRAAQLNLAVNSQHITCNRPQNQYSAEHRQVISEVMDLLKTDGIDPR